jgi:hypothetical protein
MSLQPFVGPWPLFSLLIFLHSQQDSLNGESARRKAATYTRSKRTQISMPPVVFEATIPVFEHAKTVDALYRAATVMGELDLTRIHVYVTTLTDAYGKMIRDLNVGILTFSFSNFC